MDYHRFVIGSHDLLVNDGPIIVFVAVVLPAASTVFTVAPAAVGALLIHIVDVTQKLFVGDIDFLPLQTHAVGLGIILTVETTTNES